MSDAMVLLVRFWMTCHVYSMQVPALSSHRWIFIQFHLAQHYCRYESLHHVVNRTMLGHSK